jgi:hypothetical protein
MESEEDTYIMLTSSPPSMVVCQENNRILGLSVEGAVMHVLRALEVRQHQYALFICVTSVAVILLSSRDCCPAMCNLRMWATHGMADLQV